MLVALLAGGTGCGPFARPGHPTARASPVTAASAPVDARAAQSSAVTASWDGRAEAGFTVGDAVAQLTVRTADLPGKLYQVTVGSALQPRIATRGNAVRLRLSPSGRAGLHAVTVVLNRAVRWHLRFTAGAGEQRLDLAAGRLAELDLAGAGLVRIRLPRPDRTVPLRLSALGTVLATVPAGVPVEALPARRAGVVSLPRTAGEPAFADTAPVPSGRPARDGRYRILARDVATLTVRSGGPGGAGGPR